MEWERQRTYDFENGKEAGLLQKALEDARNCLAEGDSPEKVSRCIGLPLEQVLELQEQVRQNVSEPVNSQ